MMRILRHRHTRILALCTLAIFVVLTGIGTAHAASHLSNIAHVDNCQLCVWHHAIQTATLAAAVVSAVILIVQRRTYPPQAVRSTQYASRAHSSRAPPFRSVR
ncbi:MAG: hypothetical protein O3A46_07475 [Candidatus Poribacteria bacterium]|nr:hypothetical protein [Candidatus Poribacteria bacterium]